MFEVLCITIITSVTACKVWGKWQCF